ncbi:oxidoreductase [Aliidongia dinghuensis]|uniref:Nitronate monooxygenase n=1 Tax=Aliidongia dinghuensis TaxID=1867774 RepID=A0A8J3E5P3_9PROT|nr:nitronate monooxygenase [Aliidongia dinghuensis]GGF23209.1 oxidoreductase [Aliidongia dinghuensis]
MATEFTRWLGIDHPIIQAPMAGAGSTPAMTAAVSAAGGLGSIGAAYLSLDALAAEVAEVRSRTDRPFAINLFARSESAPGAADPAPMLALIARHHEALGIEPPVLPSMPPDPLDSQLAAMLVHQPAVVSFTMGALPAADVARLKAAGIKTMGTATTVAEAKALEASGVDAIIAQGSEAGGHRGTFFAPWQAALIGTMALVPQIVDAVSVPVVAAGGIMDGRGIVAAEALGAAAVQMGTAFLTTTESGIHEAYKAALLASADTATTVTLAFSGRPARGMRNRFLTEVEAVADQILSFPLQNSTTRPMRSAAARQGDIERLSLWSGQAASLGRRMGSAELVRRLVDEAEAVRARLR